MATATTYVGVSSKARKVKNIYVGVSSKARKVTKVYAGVSGKARLVYSADWYTAGGISKTNCLAAYQFKGAASETAALKDLTGHGYTLTKDAYDGYKLDNYANWNPDGKRPCWSSGHGFHWAAKIQGGGGLVNEDLFNLAVNRKVNTAIIRYADCSGVGQAFVNLNTLSIWRFYDASESYNYIETGASMWDSGSSATRNLPVTPSPLYKSGSGVVGVNRPSYSSDSSYNWNKVLEDWACYINGESYEAKKDYFSLGWQDWINNNSVKYVFGCVSRNSVPHRGDADFANWGSFSIIAGAFYTTRLTAAQHKAVATAMLAL